MPSVQDSADSIYTFSVHMNWTYLINNKIFFLRIWILYIDNVNFSLFLI